MARDYEHLRRMFDSEFGQGIRQEMLTKFNWRALDTWYNGTRETTSNRPLNNIADFKGLKLRVPNAKPNLNYAKLSGASPTPMAFSEVYLALQTNAVDGQENPVGVIYNNGLHKLQKYMTLDGHVYAADFLLVSEDFYQTLTPAQQQVIAKAARVAGTMGRAIQQWGTAEGVNKVQAEGMQVYSPTAEEIGAFAAKAQPAVVEYLRGELGDDAEWIDRLAEAVASASQ